MRRLLALGMFLMTACSGGGPGPDTEAVGETSGASGFTITHITEGSGARPTATDVVSVHYHGTFPSGKVFDSSVERGKPASFPLNRVIPCWTEGLQQMQVGGKAKLVCPPEVAYGSRGAPPRIPPNATLYFEVELLAIK
jgi:FKBP-type peptidyl-prolyl cis-trans isomerase FkpA